MVRLGLAVLVLVGAILALPRTVPATLAWFYPEAAWWHAADGPEVLLAIDDGPDPATTPLILDALDAADAKAMFFVFGEKAAAHPELIRAIAARGHTVGAHMYRDERTFTHSGAEIADDLALTLDAIPEDVPVAFVRPGFGLPNRGMIDAAEDADLSVFVGDILPLDYYGLPGTAYRRYLDFVARPGSIVTFHDRPATGATTAQMLPLVIDDLRADGFRILPWSEFRPAP